MVMPFSTNVCFETSWIVEDWNCTRFWDVLIRDLRYYHNPIFTPEISFRVGTQNKATRLSQVRPESVSNDSKSPQNMAGAHFMRFGKVWPMLTKFDQSLTKTRTRSKARFDWPLSDHWEEHIKTFDSTLHRSKTNDKRESYGQNRKNFAKYYWPKLAHFGAMFMHRVFPTSYELFCKFETLRKKVGSTTTCNSQITKNFFG